MCSYRRRLYPDVRARKHRTVFQSRHLLCPKNSHRAHVVSGGLSLGNNRNPIQEVIPFINLLKRLGSEKFSSEEIRLEKAGIVIEDLDLMIGTTGVAGDLIVVTHNIKHFNRIKGLEYEDWVK